MKVTQLLAGCACERIELSFSFIFHIPTHVVARVAVVSIRGGETRPLQLATLFGQYLLVLPSINFHRRPISSHLIATANAFFVD